MNQSKRHIKVKTNKKVYELRPANTTVCQEWYNLFQEALNRPAVDNDNFSQVKHFLLLFLFFKTKKTLERYF